MPWLEILQPFWFKPSNKNKHHDINSYDDECPPTKEQNT